MGEVEPAGVVSVTGHTVVETAMVEVITDVESAGQLVTVGAQLVIVISLVLYTVEVVHLIGTLVAGVVALTAEERTTEGEAVDERPIDEDTDEEVAVDEATEDEPTGGDVLIDGRPLEK